MCTIDGVNAGKNNQLTIEREFCAGSNILYFNRWKRHRLQTCLSEQSLEMVGLVDRSCNQNSDLGICSY